MTTPTLSLAAALLLVATVHGLGLGALLVRSTRRLRGARLVLAALSVVIALLLAQMALLFSGIRWRRGAVGSGLWLGVAPLYYGYIRFLLPGRGPRAEDLAHLLPLAYYLLMVMAAWVLPNADRIALAGSQPVLSAAFLWFYVLQTALYAALSARLVRQARRDYQMEVAGREADIVTGLGPLAAMFGLYALVLGINMVVWMVTGAFIEWLDYLVPLALAALVAILGYRLLRRPDTVLPTLVLKRVNPEPLAPEATLLAEHLRAYLETERPYLNPDVRLSDLATHLGVTERAVSQVLTSGFGKSFYEVINGYRVEEAKARLVDPASDHLTILAVAMEAGFSSKATFNRVFKKVTGEPPSVYRSRESRSLDCAGGDGAVRAAEPVSG